MKGSSPLNAIANWYLLQNGAWGLGDPAPPQAADVSLDRPHRHSQQLVYFGSCFQWAAEEMGSKCAAFCVISRRHLGCSIRLCHWLWRFFTDQMHVFNAQVHHESEPAEP
jgi:hypothetical protein